MSINFDDANRIAQKHIEGLLSSGYCDKEELIFDIDRAKEFRDGWLFFFSPQGALMGGYSEIFGVDKDGEVLDENDKANPLQKHIKEIYKLREQEAKYGSKHGYF